jgi:hypothetical protein
MCVLPAPLEDHGQALRWNNANGFAQDWQGRLITCEHGRHRLTCSEPDGSITIMFNLYRGQRVNGPDEEWSAQDIAGELTHGWR